MKCRASGSRYRYWTGRRSKLDSLSASVPRYDFSVRVLVLRLRALIL